MHLAKLDQNFRIVAAEPDRFLHVMKRLSRPAAPPEGVGVVPMRPLVIGTDLERLLEQRFGFEQIVLLESRETVVAELARSDHIVRCRLGK